MTRGRPAIVKANPNGWSKIELEESDEIIDHLRKHNIEFDEIKSIFDQKIYYKKRGKFRDVFGKTSGGRILFVVFEKTSKHRIKPVSARDATDSEKNLYDRKAKHRI